MNRVITICAALIIGTVISAYAGRDTRIVVDCTGRSVAVPVTAGRIACLYAFAGHVVTMMGRGNDIVAVSKGLMRDSLLLEICPAIREARVPKSQGGINVEELVKAKPDLVFLSGDVGRDPGETGKLDAFHLPWLVVDYAGMDEQKNAVAMIGEALGTQGGAKAYLSYYNECMDRISTGLSTLPRNQKVRVYHSVNEADRTAIPNSLSTQWLDAVGVINVAGQNEGTLSGDKYRVGMEQILIWNPDAILVNEPSVKHLMLSDTRWSALKAVQGKRVYLLPIAISRWGHPGSVETPLAMLWAVKTFYPDRFEHIDMAQETRDFYRRFFDYALSDTQIEQILAGRLKRKPKR
ncbi:ABC transporter substrate-binding protein [Desulfatiferula olefinivorans]